MVDGEVELGVMGYRPAGDLTSSVHSQDSSWCGFLLHWYSTGFGIGSVEKVFRCPTVYQGSGGGLFFPIGPLDLNLDHDFLFVVVPGCPDSVGQIFFLHNWFLPRVAAAKAYSRGPSFPNGFSSGDSSSLAISSYVASATLYGHRNVFFRDRGHSLEKCPSFPQL